MTTATKEALLPSYPSLESQIDGKIAVGFARELNLTPGQYRDSFQSALEAVNNQLMEQLAEFHHGAVVLVELRIHFDRQAQLLGVDIDPAVYCVPKYNPGELFTL